MSIPQSPICSPAAWLGSEQKDRRDWVYVLSDGENAELDAAIRVHSARREVLEKVAASDYSLPSLAAATRGWMRELDDGRGFVLVKGFPVTDYSEDEAAFAYWLLGLQMGQPVPQNRKGDVLGM